MRRKFFPLSLLLTSVLLGCGGGSSATKFGPQGTPVSVVPATATLAVANVLQLQVVPISNGTGQLTTPTGTWSSSDTTIVKVNSSGLLLGTGAGLATVTFLCSSCLPVDVPVTVTPRASSLTINPINATVHSGSSYQFAANAVVDGKPQDVTSLAVWSINNSLGGAASILGGLLMIDSGAVATQTVIVVTASYGGLQAAAPAFVNP